MIEMARFSRASQMQHGDEDCVPVATFLYYEGPLHLTGLRVKPLRHNGAAVSLSISSHQVQKKEEP